MKKLKLKVNLLNRSAQFDIRKLNNLISIVPKKDETLLSQKTFLEIILNLVKETQVEYLTKKEKMEKKNEMPLIKGIIMKLINDLKEIKEEKEKKFKLFQIQKEEKQSNLKDLMNTINTIQKRRMNSDIISLSVLNDDDSDESSFDNSTKDQQDLKTKNFIIENRIKEIDNKMKRIKFLIEFNKIPHKFKDHFIEYISQDKNSKQYITENLHCNLLNIRDRWKDIANKKNLQEMSLEYMRTEIKNLKRESRQKTVKKNRKYINTEDVIPEEIRDTENNEEEKIINKIPENTKTYLKNIILNSDQDDKDDIKLSIKEMEKLLKLKMNINFNINLNKQYINNHYNNYAPNQLGENISKNKKEILRNIG